MIEFYPEGQLIDKLENVSLMSSMENLQEACQRFPQTCLSY